ncbi:MAG: hypothetical protein ACXVB6_18625 [Mucilaginibacter sp.]
MKKRILSMIALGAVCTMLITSCAEKHMAPPPPPPGAPGPPPPPSK